MLDLDESLIKIYEDKQHLKLEEIQRTLGTTISNPGESTNYFDSEIPLAVFILDGAVYNHEGKIVEIEKSFYRGDKYKFAVSAKPQLNNNIIKANQIKSKTIHIVALYYQISQVRQQTRIIAKIVIIKGAFLFMSRLL